MRQPCANHVVYDQRCKDCRGADAGNPKGWTVAVLFVATVLSSLASARQPSAHDESLWGWFSLAQYAGRYACHQRGATGEAYTEVGYSDEKFFLTHIVCSNSERHPEDHIAFTLDLCERSLDVAVVRSALLHAKRYPIGCRADETDSDAWLTPAPEPVSKIFAAFSAMEDFCGALDSQFSNIVWTRDGRQVLGVRCAIGRLNGKATAAVSVCDSADEDVKPYLGPLREALSAAGVFPLACNSAEAKAWTHVIEKISRCFDARANEPLTEQLRVDRGTM